MTVTNVTILTAATDFVDFLSQRDAVVIYFGDKASCAPCKRFRPHFEAAAERSTIPFVYVDIRECDEDFIEMFSVTSVPSVFYVETKGFRDTKLNHNIGAMGLLSQIVDLENARLAEQAEEE